VVAIQDKVFYTVMPSSVAVVFLSLPVPYCIRRIFSWFLSLLEHVLRPSEGRCCQTLLDVILVLQGTVFWTVTQHSDVAP